MPFENRICAGLKQPFAGDPIRFGDHDRNQKGLRARQ